MLPLALSGTPIIAAAVAIALVLVMLLFRAEDRFEADDRAAERAAAARAGGSPPHEQDR